LGSVEVDFCYKISFLMTEALKSPTLKQRLLSGSAWALTGKAASVFAALIVNALLARLLSPQDFGAYFLALSMVYLGATVGALGLNELVVRSVAESTGLGQFGRVRRVVSLTFRLGVLGALGVGIAYLSVGHVVGEDLFGAPSLASVTGLVAGWIVVMVVQMLLAEVFRGFNDLRLASIFGGSSSSILLAFCLILLWLLAEQATLPVVVLLALGSSAASTLLAGWLLRRKVATLPWGGAEDKTGHGQILRAAWPFLVTSLSFSALTQADIWILGAFRPQEDVAIYGAAARMVILLPMPAMIVHLVVMPLVAEMYAQGRRTELERILRSMATLGSIPASLVLATFVLLGGPILGLVYGDYYRTGTTVLALLSLGQLVNVWTGCCTTTLMMTGHQLAMMTITMVCGSLTIVAILLVVGPYGSTGVAVATAAGLGLQSILMWLGARAATGMWTHAGLAGLFGSKGTAGTG
jgi:O-antigen/teichoic acid export membrane protein